MKLNQFICTDALSGLKRIDDNSINLVLTSPPYATIRKSYDGIDAEEYSEWFEPILREIYRVLTSNGSFILNINDKCKNKERIPYPFEIVIKAREIGLKYVDTIIWKKRNGVPAAGRRRADYFEYIFHLAKSVNPVFNKDEIRTPYAKASIKRAEKPIKNNVSNRESRKTSTYKKWILNDKGAFPNNVLDFPKDSGKTHVGSFHIDLPKHFILAHSQEGDIVLDPFAGRGTTLEASRLLGRSYLGFDIKQEYIELAKTVYNI